MLSLLATLLKWLDNHDGCFILTLENLHLTNVFSTGLTVLCIKRLKAATTVWSAILHDIALAPQNGLTFKTGEVLHVPMTPLCFCALISKDNL